ncbi:MAG: carboxypeptidase, partial [Acidobacteria bacterium]
MDDTFKNLESVFGEIIDLRRAAALLEWDERVCMPEGGVQAHGGELLSEAKERVKGLDRDSDLHRLVTVAARDYDKATRVPAAFVSEQAQTVSAAHHAWVEARSKSDFSIFRPHLQKVVDLKRRYVAFFPEVEQPYVALLDGFEPGMKPSEVQEIFDTLGSRQVTLVQSLVDRPQIDDTVLHLPYAEKDIWDFGVEIMTSFGFDWARGRQDKSAHPFATSAGPGDVRVTTRFDASQPFGLLFGTLHETGHA